MLDMEGTEDRQSYVRLGQAVMHRRANELEISQADLADRSGLGQSTIQKIERGTSKRLRKSTKLALEKGLQWHPDSVNAVLAGGDPLAAEATPDVAQPTGCRAPRPPDGPDLDDPGEATIWSITDLSEEWRMAYIYALRARIAEKGGQQHATRHRIG